MAAPLATMKPRISTSANKGTLDANLQALSLCKTPDEQKSMIFDMLGDLSNIRILKDRVIVATYVDPTVSKGGIIFTDRRRDESRFQGKVGLVVAIGPTAFRYDGAFEWEGPKPQIGDWVWYRASDAPERGINDVFCRTIESELIEGITDDPRVIY